MPTIAYNDTGYLLPYRVYNTGHIDTRESYRISIPKCSAIHSALFGSGIEQFDRVYMQIALFVQNLQESRDYFWSERTCTINFKAGMREIPEYLHLYNESDFLAFKIKFGV